MFRLVVLAVVLGLQTLLYARARRWQTTHYPASRSLRILIPALFVLFGGAMAAVLLVRPRVTEFPGWLAIVAVNPFYIWHGATLMLGIVVLAGLIIALPFRIGRRLLRVTPGIRSAWKRIEVDPRVQRFDASRRVFLRRGMYGLTAASFGSAAYGVLSEQSSMNFTRQRVVIPSLPPEFEGFTIGMISDVHAGAFMSKADMDRYASTLNDLHADMIVIPGDFVNGMVSEVYPLTESFSALRAPHGVFGVMGNHEYYTQDPERVAREIDECGVKMLRNDHVVIRKGSGVLTLFGVDDAGRPERALAMMETARGNVPVTGASVLLCHRPYFLEQAASQDFDLVLSGHTHGGQIVLGRVGRLSLTPAQLVSPYVWGLYREGGTQMFVSRGIGTVGIPMRINCPPEVVVLTLARS
jgi:predicted MPP superfamily phosphohydrolase